MPEFSARFLVPLLVASAGGCTLGNGPVTRVADGREYEARAISADAYAQYARGALLEAQGEDQKALGAYQAALKEDDDSPEIHARIGAVRCRLAHTPTDALGQAATRYLSRATKLDPYSSSAWTETAKCAAHRGQTREALSAALRAASSDPVAIDSALLVVEFAEAAGDVGRARVWLDELVARAPRSREAWAALRQFAIRHADLGRELRARAGLSRLGIGPGAPAGTDLDAALSRGELGAVRAAALAARLSPGELAARLAERGMNAAAAEQAALVLGADPDDANAWVASLITADLRRDQAELERTLANAPTAPSQLSPTAARLHGQLLERLVGLDARAAWFGALPK